MNNPLKKFLGSLVTSSKTTGERRAIKFAGVSLNNPPNWLEKLLIGAPGNDEDPSGQDITEWNALSISAVYACVRAISDDVAKLPLLVYRDLDAGGKEKLKNHPVYNLLRWAPNENMSAFDFRQTVTAHALLWGNGFAEIERDGNARPTAFCPLQPDCVQVRWSTIDGSLIYVYRDPYTQASRTIFAADMIHIKGLGYNGLVGYSVVAWARKSMGLTAAAEKFGASFYGNSSMPKGVLEHPGILGDEGQKNLRKSWEAVHRGADKYGNTAILEEGMKFSAITIPPNDAQFLETRQFQIPEICRWYRVPPHKIADLSRSTFSNIEQQSIEYVSDSLLPWLVRWEQEIKRKCFMQSERTLFAEHLTAAALRGDLKSRYEAYAIGRNWGWLSPNDVCSAENLNPIDEDAGGDVYLVPMNMMNSETIIDPPDAVPEPGDGTEPAGTSVVNPPFPAAPDPAAKKPAAAAKKPVRRPSAPAARSTMAFRTLMLEAIAKMRRTEADKFTRRTAAQDPQSFASKFVSDRLRESEASLLPITTAFVGAFRGEIPAQTLVDEARSLAQDLAGSHIARLADVFAGDWVTAAEARSVVWIDDTTEEVDDAMRLMSSIVEARNAEEPS